MENLYTDNQRLTEKEACTDADDLLGFMADNQMNSYAQAQFEKIDDDANQAIYEGWLDREAREDLGLYVEPIDGGCPDTEETEPYCDEDSERY